MELANENDGQRLGMMESDGKGTWSMEANDRGRNLFGGVCG